MSALDAPTRATTPAAWLALLAGPLSFGIAGPALVLDDVARGLSVDPATATATVTAFGWGIAVGTPLTGALLRDRGVRAALAVSATLVAAGAALVLAVPVLAAVVGGTAVAALGAAGLTATALSLAGTPRRMGVVTASLAVVGSVAPLAGSLVADLLGWRAALALPLVALLAVPAVARRAGSTPESGVGFDVRGAVLLTVLVSGLVLVPSYPVPGAVAAVVGLVALGVHVRARPDGMVPASAVARIGFLVPAVSGFLLAVVNFGLIYALPVRLADLTPWSAGEIGIAMVWPLLLGGVLSFPVVAASGRVGRCTAGVVLVAASLAGALLGGTAGLAVLLLVAQGVTAVAAASGQGVFTLQAVDGLTEEDRPRAVGLFTLCYLLGAAFGPGIAVLAVG